MKQVVVLSDVELGAGTITDDFISDETLSRFIKELAAKKEVIDLVFNGDTFDFLKCPYKIKPKLAYTRYITEDVSLRKLKLIHKAHKKVFEALRIFTSKRGKTVHFIVGNHDQDILYDGVKKQLRKYISKKIYFPGYAYKKHGIYIEHGQQYDPANKVHPKEKFLRYGTERILNYSIVSFAVMSSFIMIKEEHPLLERVKPIPFLFSLKEEFAKKINWKISVYFFKSLVYYPIRHIFDPTYKFPSEFVKEFVRRVKTWNWDIDEIVSNFKIHKQNLLKRYKIFVFGHIHEEYIEKSKRWTILRAGSWRDEYELEKKRRILLPCPKPYIIINVPTRSWQIKRISVARSVWDFEEVQKDEMLYIKKAQEEENYSPPDY